MSREFRSKKGSLSERVIAFLAENPDEELTSRDIAIKFTVDQNSVIPQLKCAVDAGALRKEHNDDLQIVYRLGKRSSSPFAALAGEMPTTPTAEVLAALPIDEDVPLKKRTPGLSEKWAPLFERLKKPGQSMAVPLVWRQSLSLEAGRRNKATRARGETAPTFKVGKDHDTPHARVWRVT